MNKLKIQLKFDQINKPTPTRATAAEIMRRSHSNEKNGYFEWKGLPPEIKGGFLFVRFRLAIYVSKDLSREETKKVLAHEEQHFQDFKTLAEALKKSIQTALDHGQDPQMDARREWFNYDVNEKFNEQHRRQGRMVKIAFPPSVPRPE